jgi:hypothetical protein
MPVPQPPVLVGQQPRTSGRSRVHVQQYRPLHRPVHQTFSYGRLANPRDVPIGRAERRRPRGGRLLKRRPRFGVPELIGRCVGVAALQSPVTESAPRLGGIWYPPRFRRHLSPPTFGCGF